ncbi:MAG TPA: GlsB/YeaQ/YmgE family stress response membrane protein [Casimicrobiaceae bacterium]|nr:GlsB/YeaQ/YmgE family stress response membrane protein [Casimicrobiaceae bacterium]
MGIFSLIWMVIIGFIVGALARWFYPGTIAMGFWATALVGIVGSLVGGVISSLLFRRPGGGYHPAGIVLSILGALIVLWAYLNYR